jgi:hypothetical protein
VRTGAQPALLYLQRQLHHLIERRLGRVRNVHAAARRQRSGQRGQQRLIADGDLGGCLAHQCNDACLHAGGITIGGRGFGLVAAHVRLWWT